MLVCCQVVVVMCLDTWVKQSFHTLSNTYTPSSSGRLRTISDEIHLTFNAIYIFLVSSKLNSASPCAHTNTLSLFLRGELHIHSPVMSKQAIAPSRSPWPFRYVFAVEPSPLLSAAYGWKYFNSRDYMFVPTLKHINTKLKSKKKQEITRTHHGSCWVAISIVTLSKMSSDWHTSKFKMLNYSFCFDRHLYKSIRQTKMLVFKNRI